MGSNARPDYFQYQLWTSSLSMRPTVAASAAESPERFSSSCHVTSQKVLQIQFVP